MQNNDVLLVWIEDASEKTWLGMNLTSGKLGFTHVHLPGGEPLVKRNIESLVEMIHLTGKYREITMTTNGALLEQQLPHINRLLCESVDAAVADAEIVVVGHATDEYDRDDAWRSEGKLVQRLV